MQTILHTNTFIQKDMIYDGVEGTLRVAKAWAEENIHVCIICNSTMRYTTTPKELQPQENWGAERIHSKYVNCNTSWHYLYRDKMEEQRLINLLTNWRKHKAKKRMSLILNLQRSCKWESHWQMTLYLGRYQDIIQSYNIGGSDNVDNIDNIDRSAITQRKN